MGVVCVGSVDFKEPTDLLYQSVLIDIQKLKFVLGSLAALWQLDYPWFAS